jgi:hypothetical protein
MTSLIMKARRFLVGQDDPMTFEYAVMLVLIIMACIAV